MIILQNIYNKSPIIFQNIMTSSSGAIKARQRYGNIYSNHRQWLTEYDDWPLEAKLKHQSDSLRDFVTFAKSKSSFYRELYGSVDTNFVQSTDDLGALPTVDKEMLRSNIHSVYTVDSKHSVESQTGGTTGKPLVVRYTISDSMRRQAVIDHFKSRVGFENRTMTKATFSGKPIVPPRQKSNVYWRRNRAANQFLYSTFHLNEDNLHYYVKHLNAVKPEALDGFVTSLSDIASYIERNNITVEFRPIGIFPTAETVTASTRALLERVFNCKVYDQYASSEGAPFVTECSHGSLHMELSTGVFEQFPGSDEILVTSFQTHGTPLIRYRIGDSMNFDLTGNCACGVEGPLVETIYGRSADHLLRTDGAKVNSAHVSNLFKNLPVVLVQAQVIQRRLGELEVLLVVDNRTHDTKVEQILRQEILSAFGSETTAHFHYVDHIPRAESGKHRLVRNLVSEDELIF